MEGLVVLLLLVGLPCVLFVIGMRWTRRRPSPSDMRRADDAESQKEPTPEEKLDRIMEAFGETRPPGF